MPEAKFDLKITKDHAGKIKVNNSPPDTTSHLCQHLILLLNYNKFIPSE